jgi:hypothetical protein
MNHSHLTVEWLTDSLTEAAGSPEEQSLMGMVETRRAPLLQTLRIAA